MFMLTRTLALYGLITVFYLIGVNILATCENFQFSNI